MTQPQTGVKIPMPRLRNPAINKLTFEALANRVLALEKLVEELRQGRRGRPPKDDINDTDK